jgi:hypothetical protein
MDSVEPEDQRDAEPRPGGGLAERLDLGRGEHVQHCSDVPVARLLDLLARRLGPGQQVELPDLFVERHAGEQRGNPRLDRRIAGRSIGADSQGLQRQNDHEGGDQPGQGKYILSQ